MHAFQVFNLTILTVLDLIPKEPLDHKIFYVVSTRASVFDISFDVHM